MTTNLRTVISRAAFVLLALIAGYTIFKGGMLLLWLVPIHFLAGIISHLLYPLSPMIEPGMVRTPRFRFWISFFCGFLSLFVLGAGDDFEITTGQKI
jgi:hypothetical protein